MRVVRFVIPFVLFVMVLAGLSVLSKNLHARRVNEAYAQLRIGMNRAELDKVFHGVRLVIVQRVDLYPGRNDTEMRANFYSFSHDDLHPIRALDSVTFDGSCRVLNYLIKKRYNYPNGWFTDYIFVFYDTKNDCVLGWGKDTEVGEFSDKF